MLVLPGKPMTFGRAKHKIVDMPQIIPHAKRNIDMYCISEISVYIDRASIETSRWVAKCIVRMICLIYNCFEV